MSFSIIFFASIAQFLQIKPVAFISYKDNTSIISTLNNMLCGCPELQNGEVVPFYLMTIAYF